MLGFAKFGFLNFGHWCLFGIWCLGFGASYFAMLSALCPMLSASLSFPHDRDPVWPFSYVNLVNHPLSYEAVPHQALCVLVNQINIIFFTINSHISYGPACPHCVNGNKGGWVINFNNDIILPAQIDKVCSGINLY